MKPDHTHVFKATTKVVRLHNYRKEQGVQEAVDMTARDVLKQFVCACGKVETYDMERTKLL